MSNIILEAVFGIANMIIPRNGPKIAPVTLEFDNFNTVEVNAEFIQSRGHIDVIQGIYIDNGSNGDPLEVAIGTTGQRIKVKPFTQGYYPVLAPKPFYGTFKTPSAPKKTVELIFYNVPIQGQNWATQ